jgi:hypothetical protein
LKFAATLRNQRLEPPRAAAYAKAFRAQARPQPSNAAPECHSLNEIVAIDHKSAQQRALATLAQAMAS